MSIVIVFWRFFRNWPPGRSSDSETDAGEERQPQNRPDRNDPARERRGMPGSDAAEDGPESSDQRARTRREQFAEAVGVADHAQTPRPRTDGEPGTPHECEIPNGTPHHAGIGERPSRVDARRKLSAARPENPERDRGFDGVTPADAQAHGDVARAPHRRLGEPKRRPGRNHRRHCRLARRWLGQYVVEDVAPPRDVHEEPEHHQGGEQDDRRCRIPAPSQSRPRPYSARPSRRSSRPSGPRDRSPRPHALRSG